MVSNKMLEWFLNNKEWLLSGLGVTVILFVFGSVKRLILRINQKGKLKITYTFKQAWEQTIFGQGPVFPLYSFEITNIGKVSVEIKDIQLDFCGKKIDTQWGKLDGLSQIDTRNPHKYLGELKPTKYIKGDFEISSFLPVINGQLKPKSNVRLKVVDSLENVYYSKKAKYKSFLNNVQVSKNVNMQRKQ